LSSTYAYELGGSTSVRGFSDETQEIDRIFVTNVEFRLEPADGFTASPFFDWGVDLERVQADEMLASAGFELGILVVGIFVRLDVVWVFGDDAGWAPRFDFAFGSMF
jgi:hemolysin activation/secretion protein